MLVNCVAYKNGVKIRDIFPGEVDEFLVMPDCFVWVALVDPSEDELKVYQAEFGLHELAVEDALKGHQRAKIEEFGDSLFVVVKTIETYGASFTTGEVHIFAGRNYILSVRRNSMKGFGHVRTRCEAEPHLLEKGSGFVLYALMDEIVDRYFPVIEQLEENLEIVESKIFVGRNARASVEQLYALKQTVVEIKHVVVPLLEAVSKLQGGRVPSVCVQSQEYFRDVYDHLYRINSAVENVREMLFTAIQVNLSLISLGESEDNKRLAAGAALFAVPTMIAGIYGMNFENMPELKHRYGYYIALFVMIFVDLVLYIRFKKSRWL
ncbi:MAG TPA: magnesium/cobalt transporter CorA [Pseudobdellovibrionaceae bacterium]|nr:magnesium/cobalt transporter CorA [Pseudobdellovibrionaceae bacterium]